MCITAPLPYEFKIGWVSTARAADAITTCRANLLPHIKLHRLVQMTDLPVSLHKAHLVVMEIPPVSEQGYEQQIAKAIARVQAVNNNIAVVVPQSYRKHIRRTTWVQRWNKLDNIPFKIYQTCSCKVAGAPQDKHYTYQVGATFPIQTQACPELPSITEQAEALRSLDLIVHNFGQELLAELLSQGDSLPDLASAPLPCLAQHHPSLNPAGNSEGSKRTPDSALSQDQEADGRHQPKVSSPTDAKERERE